MKQGTAYARQIRRLYHDLLKKYGKPAIPEPMEPLHALIVGLLLVDTPDPAKAHAFYRRLCEQMVDLNELRVTPVIELAAMIGNQLPFAEDKARRIVSALQDIRRRQDTLDLSFLRQRGRREAREYLESLEGVSPAAAAFVTLFSLGGHAIPVDDLTVHVLKRNELVNPAADRTEVQNFLERNISAAEAAEFTLLLSRFVCEQTGRFTHKKLAELLRPPPAVPPPASPASSPAQGRAGAASGSRPASPANSPATQTSSRAAAPSRSSSPASASKTGTEPSSSSGRARSTAPPAAPPSSGKAAGAAARKKEKR